MKGEDTKCECPVCKTKLGLEISEAIYSKPIVGFNKTSLKLMMNLTRPDYKRTDNEIETQPTLNTLGDSEALYNYLGKALKEEYTRHICHSTNLIAIKEQMGISKQIMSKTAILMWD